MSAIINQSGRLRSDSVSRYALGMTREKFEIRAAKRGGFTLKEFRQFHEVIPCVCGKKKCKGWNVKWKFGSKRRAEGNW